MDVLETFDFSRFVPLALNIIGAIIVLILTLYLAGWSKRYTYKKLSKSKIDETLAKFFSNFAKYTILVLGIIAVLGVFGIPVASFAAILAAVGFAVGLAMQGTLSNFSAGIMLLLFRPYKIGDYVAAAGTSGTVKEIELFTTILDTPDNRRIIVPNGSIFGSTIENITHHSTRRVDVNVGTEYTADLSESRKVLESVVNNMEGVHKDPAPVVYLLELGDSSINWAVRAWTDTSNYWALREKLTHEIKTALDNAKIGIPFPQMDIHIDGQLNRE